MRLNPEIPVTERERQIIELIADGCTSAMICQRLYIQESTIKTHVRRIGHRLNVRGRASIVSVAYQLGILTIPVDGPVDGPVDTAVSGAVDGPVGYVAIHPTAIHRQPVAAIDAARRANSADRRQGHIPEYRAYALVKITGDIL